MHKSLRLTVWIVLFAFALAPLSNLVVAYEVHDPRCNCAGCGAGVHSPPVYEHASDCPCSDCVAERENDPLGFNDDDSFWSRYIKPTITTYVPEPVVNFFLDNLENIGNSAAMANQMGGPPNPMNAW